jgi:hypothetical protein
MLRLHTYFVLGGIRLFFSFDVICDSSADRGSVTHDPGLV